MKGNTLTLPAYKATVVGFDGTGVVVRIDGSPEWAHGRTLTLSYDNRKELNTTSGTPQIGEKPVQKQAIRPQRKDHILVRISGGPTKIEAESWSLLD